MPETETLPLNRAGRPFERVLRDLFQRGFSTQPVFWGESTAWAQLWQRLAQQGVPLTAWPEALPRYQRLAS
ncbi:MAG: hypothetical protein HC918_05875 [Oscillatoriales cyanobacterium SM2_1_8]|nr:hypothetical protein [Oscillatoriales cyanobacterium SM2_1_8]